MDAQIVDADEHHLSCISNQAAQEFQKDAGVQCAGADYEAQPALVGHAGDPPALVMPAVDLHLPMSQSWIGGVRAYGMAEFFIDLPGSSSVTTVTASDITRRTRSWSENDGVEFWTRDCPRDLVVSV